VDQPADGHEMTIAIRALRVLGYMRLIKVATKQMTSGKTKSLRSCSDAVRSDGMTRWRQTSPNNGYLERLDPGRYWVLSRASWAAPGEVA